MSAAKQKDEIEERKRQRERKIHHYFKMYRRVFEHSSSTGDKAGWAETVRLIKTKP